MHNLWCICSFAVSIMSPLAAQKHVTPQNTGFVDVPIQDRRESYYDFKAQSIAEYSVPTSVQVKRYRHSLDQSSFTGELVLGGDLAKARGERLMYEIYFAKPGLSYEIGLIAPVGRSAYPSIPVLKPGKAGLVDLRSGRLIAPANLSIERDRVTISCSNPALTGKHVTFGLVRYAPRSLTDARVGYGYECVVQMYHEAPELREYKKQLPSHPVKH